MAQNFEAQKYYLAVDIGASSGRHILGSMKNGRIVLEEVYRFKNGLVQKNGHLCWDLDSLFQSILEGMKECGKRGKIPVTMGIDTWAVDFVLLDKNDQLLGDTVAYRDGRTQGIDKEIEKTVPFEELYRRTGIQKLVFNTIYQLAALKKEHPEYLEKAKSYLMSPEYFNFLLTGKKLNEYTNASSTALLDAYGKKWDKELLEKLGFPSEIFGELHLPKTSVGRLTETVKKEVGFDCEVVLPATHDTGSAVLAVPANDDDYIYLSSGTWSLMGVESMTPNCSDESRRLNFTNEGGADYRFRYLKNIMGLWMIQSVKKELEDKYSFDDLCELARQAKEFHSLVNVNDNTFLAPDSMIDAIKNYCRQTRQQEPETIGEISACVYNSLASSYASTINELEELTGKSYSRLHIVGGGCKDAYLNELTARYTGKQVYAGPVEATALGNLLAQMLKEGIFSSLEEARSAVAASFDIRAVEV